MLQQLLWLLVFSADMHHLQRSARFASVDDLMGRASSQTCATSSSEVIQMCKAP